MTSATMPFDPFGLLQDVYVDTRGMVITGPNAGIWTVTLPDTITQQTLDDAVAFITALRTANINKLALLAKASPAVESNKDYLAITTPNNTQAALQIKAMTRQLNALMKLVAEDLSNTLGT